MQLNNLRLPELAKKFGRSKSSLHNDINDGLLTPPIKYGPRMSCWPEHEINSIIAARIEGQCENQIKNLVLNLIEARKNISKYLDLNLQQNYLPPTITDGASDHKPSNTICEDQS